MWNRFCEEFLDLSKYINAYGDFKKKLQKVGANPYSKSSKLNKFTGWGNSMMIISLFIYQKVGIKIMMEMLYRLKIMVSENG